MTKHPVTRWYRLAIAAVVPLVLTVCYTPPDAIDSISDLGNVEVEVPSTTALAAAEPVPPVRPEMAAAALAQPSQPAPDAGLIGPDGTATLAARTEPSPPPHPAVLAVVPMGEVGVPGTPMGVGPDQSMEMEPTAPAHPVTLAVVPAGEPAVPGTPMGVGPDQSMEMEPTAPAHPVTLAVVPAGEPAVPGTPMGVGPDQSMEMEPTAPAHPVTLAVVPAGEPAVPGTPMGVGPDQSMEMEPTAPAHPVTLAVVPAGEPAVPGTPMGVGPDQSMEMEPTAPAHPVTLAVVPAGEPAVPGTPMGVGPDQSMEMEPTAPAHPVTLAMVPAGEPAVPGTPMGVGADGTPDQGTEMEPMAPGHPVMVAGMIGVPGEIGVPAGVGADGTAMQAAYVAPVRPGHPAMGAVAASVPGGIGVPLGAGTGESPQLGAQMEPPRPAHPEAPAASLMAALAEPAAPLGADGADAVRDRAGVEPPAAPLHPAMDWSVPAVAAQPAPAGAAGPSVITGPTDADFDRVRVLIARAEEVDADFYDPQNLNAARDALALAERIRASDPVGSHVALAVAEARATEAFESAVRLTAERLRKLLAQRLEELREIQADLWVPVSFQEMVDAVQRVEELFAAGDLFGAYELALATADDMLTLRDSLLDRLELLYGARAETERCLAAAQNLDTSTWTASRLAELQSLYDQLNALYLVGLEAMQSYRLADAEEAFGAAVEVCRRLMAVADDAYMDLRDQAAALMKAVMEEIEEASALHVITETGDVIRPQPWNGQEVLDQLRAGGAQRDALLDGIGREGQNDLQTAQGLWMEGVVEFDDEKYGQAISLFEDARRYLERYKFYVVLGIHTVRLIPERRESLWRIAEYPQWYSDPFLWPRIWRRNRDLIQNPDLIYPGWQLIIPAI